MNLEIDDIVLRGPGILDGIDIDEVDKTLLIHWVDKGEKYRIVISGKYELKYEKIDKKGQKTTIFDQKMEKT